MLMKRLFVAALLCGACLVGPIHAQQNPLSSIVNNGTIAVTNTFATILPADSGRKGCTLQNQGTHVMYLHIGALAAATLAKALQMQPQDKAYCQTPSGVIFENLNLTGTAGDAWWMSNQ